MRRSSRILQVRATPVASLAAAALAAALADPLAGPIAAQSAGPPAGVPAADTLFDAAYAAWDTGDYVRALEGLARLLDRPDAGGRLPDIAVLTGERYRTVEVAVDGTRPRWSPDGRHAAYEAPTGSPTERERGPVTWVVAIDEDGTVQPVAEIAGYGAVFSPDGSRIAWLRTVDAAALEREQASIRDSVEVRDRAGFIRLREALAAARARHARVRVRDLATGRERDIPSSEPVHAVAWSGGEAVPWIAGPEVQVSPGGTHIAYADDDGLALLTIETGWQRTFPASGSATFSADGSTVAFVSGEGGSHAVRALRLDGPGADQRLPKTVLATADELASPALSADGSWVAFQREGRENQEVWIARVPTAGEGAHVGPEEDVGSAAPRRLTHDVQHDLFPRFLAGDRLLVIKGEGRHRRSYVYPVAPGGDPAVREWVPGLGEGMRLFHNNTVRTVAPEYEWAVSPDGTRVLIVAERDGDTISPERGVYLTDLTRPVPAAEVRERVAGQLAAERDLRDRGARLFAPVADAVRAAVADVSVSRIHGYEADLFRFGSKHIARPGNAKAVEYLADRLREFGYEPELQWFEPRPGIRSANVVARLEGTAHPDVVYVVSSHFDSVERGPGADDNTSGTAALLEAARVLATRPQAASIELAFFTGEEAGLLGSREYTRRAVAEGKSVVGALNNDMVGYANDDRPDDTIRYSNAGIRDLQHAAAILFTDLILYDAHYYKSTDAHALFDAFGDVIGGIGSYPILANPHYHQTHDVLETIDHRLVAEVAKTTVASILRMAAGPSRVSGLEVAPAGGGVELRWAEPPESDVRRWVVRYGPESHPTRASTEADAPTVRLPDARMDWRFEVVAVNEAGVEAWDAARKGGE